MKKFVRANDNSEFVIENNIVYKLINDVKIEIDSKSDTAKRVKDLANGTASNGTKKKFGLAPAAETKQEVVKKERPKRQRRGKMGNAGK